MEHDALNIQVGGNHYKDCKIQPVEYIHANQLGFCEGNVVKYITRWKSKNGIKDLEKARHYIDLLIQLEGRTPNKAKNGEEPDKDIHQAAHTHWIPWTPPRGSERAPDFTGFFNPQSHDIQVEYRNGERAAFNNPSAINWRIDGYRDDFDVMAYRLIPK